MIFLDKNLRNFANGLKRARKKAGYRSQKRFVEALNEAYKAEGFSVTVDTVENWEQGKSSPAMNVFLKLCDFFDCSADYLLYKIDEKNHDLQFIHDCTGLSENSIGFLYEMTHSHTEDDRRKLEVINLLLDDSNPENYEYWKRIQAFLFSNGEGFMVSLPAGDFPIKRDDLLSTLLTLNNAYLLQLKSEVWQ